MPAALENVIHAVSGGGPVMLALALTSLLLYKHTIGLFVFVRQVNFDDLTNDRELTHFAAVQRTRMQGEDSVLRMQIKIFDETVWQFKQLVSSRIKYANALLAAAPLLGLLGTVMGMLDTFHGLSLQLGNETTRTVSEGISRALITTQTGLMIAIPALFLIHWIKRETHRAELLILERKMQILSRLEN